MGGGGLTKEGVKYVSDPDKGCFLVHASVVNMFNKYHKKVAFIINNCILVYKI